MRKKFFHVITVLILILSVCMLGGCSKKVSDFTEEEHIRRVTERIEKQVMTDSTKYIGFSVYPLYNEDDELQYFLVEYEPYGFMFIQPKDEEWKGLSCLGVSTSMYRVSNVYTGDDEYGTWSPYTIDETNSQPFPETDKRWKVDEDGNRICYTKSPYYVTQNINERKYLLRSDKGFICAIKKDDAFINLVSSIEINISNGDLTKKQATLNITFIANKRFDL